MKFNRLFFVIISALTPNHLIAEELSDWNVMIGGIIAADNMPWKGYKTQVRAFPYIDINKDNFFVSVEKGIGYNFPFSDNISSYTSVSYRDDSYNENGVSLTNLEKHKIFNEYKTPSGEALANIGIEAYFISISMSQDISNKTDSTSANIGLNFDLFSIGENFSTKFNSGVTFYDKKYVNHYYGVSPQNVNNSVGRIHYRTEKNTTNYEFGLTTIYSFADSWVILASANYTVLGREIYESPLLNGKKWYGNLLLGVACAF